MRKGFLCLVLSSAMLAGMGFLSPTATLAVYPEKPVTLLVGFAPGGAQDMAARAMTEAVKKHFPKPLVMVNRPGAAGTISVSEVLRSKPDGYTIGITTAAILIIQPLRTKLPYTSPEDFTLIIKVVSNPNLIAVNSTAPWKTIQEFIAYAQSNPGKVRVSIPGIGNELHLCVEQLKRMAKADFTSVPFSGSGEGLPAMIGGHVEAISTHPNSVVGHGNAGKIRVLLFFGEKRSPLFPDGPCSKELGYDIIMAVTSFFIGPKGIPPQIVSILHDALKKGMEDPIFEKPIKAQGFEISYMAPEDLKKHLMKEYEEYAKLVELLDLKGK